MIRVLQKVQAGNVKPGQKVRFRNKQAWWKVERVHQGITLIRRGKSTQRLTSGYPLLQEPFDNL